MQVEKVAQGIWTLAYHLHENAMLGRQQGLASRSRSIETQLLIGIDITVLLLDSASVKVHPDGIALNGLRTFLNANLGSTIGADRIDR